MITYIRMKNFKSWKDSGEVKLAPLTGFFGTNSSGKSSLLQMLLLLKQTAERSDPEAVIFFGDENSLVNLGNFHEVIHGHKDGELLALEFGCKLQDLLTIEIPPGTDRFGASYEYTLEIEIDRFTFGTGIRGDAGSSSVEQFSYTVGPEPIFEIRWESGEIYYGNFHYENIKIKNCYGSLAKGYADILYLLPSALEKLFSRVYYLGPTRVHPQRCYHWEGTHPKEIDMWGNKVVDALLSAHMRKSTIVHSGETISIRKRISKWLQKLGLAYDFQFDPTGDLDDRNYEVRFQKSPNSAKVTLADMGHGVADLFPLLVHCCYVPEGSTLILEQPGIHLHPKAQADLADMFLEVITERNLQILVESHSEHLLTRLQRRIAEKQVSQNDIGLYFCRNTDGVSTLEQLEVDESGDIKNWPDNFFGDVMGDMFAMTDTQVERMTEGGTED